MKQNIRNLFTSCVGILLLAYLIHYQYVRQKRQDISPVATTIPQIAQGQATWQFQKTIFDFGTIQAGTMVKHAYVFTNIGTQPLVIHEIIPSCKLCTKASFTRQVVQPAEQGSIMVEFNSTGRTGKQGKYVTICSNAAASPTRVLIKGEIR